MATLIGSIVVFMLVIALHEFGHFSVAKLCGIRVNEFSIGMGPMIVNKVKGDTQYTLRLLPLGGYVAMEGEEEASDDPRSFNNASVSKRMAVVVAGVCMNFILAIISFFLIGIIYGVISNSNTIGGVLENSPAYVAGIQEGDKIVSIDSVEVRTWDEILENISAKENKDIDIQVEREGEVLAMSIPTTINEGRAVIGISPSLERSLISSIKFGFTRTHEVIKSVFVSLKMLFTGDAGVDELAGPVGVIVMIGDQTKKGFGYLLNILGIISANLGIVNLLPIPALDGGKLLFFIIEAIIGRPISEKVQTNLSLVSMAFLLGLVLYVTIFGDIARLMA